MEKGKDTPMPKGHNEVNAVTFCFCGRVAELKYGGVYCKEHFKKGKPIKKYRIGKYSGRSKSPHRFNDYQT